MVLFSASVAAVSFAASGRLNVPYAVLFGSACLVAAFLGVLVVGRLVKRSGRASLIVLLLAAIMGERRAPWIAVGYSVLALRCAGTVIVHKVVVRCHRCMYEEPGTWLCPCGCRRVAAAGDW